LPSYDSTSDNSAFTFNLAQEKDKKSFKGNYFPLEAFQLWDFEFLTRVAN
jgi:hypothetical protein